MWPVRIATIATILLVGSVLLARAAWTGLWCDELLFHHAAVSSLPTDVFVAGSSHPPLARWLFRPWLIEGAPDWLVRLPSVAAAVMTIVVWSRIAKRIVGDRASLCLLVAAMSLNTAWLGLGYQCVPYALLVLVVSLHTLSWFWLREHPGWWSGAVFVASGALAAWIHFYGINLLLADQLVWAALLLRRAVPARRWLWITLTTFLLTSPLLPLVAFYSTLDAPFITAPAAGYPEYFFNVSAQVFSRSTFYGLRVASPAFLAWYAVACWLLLAVAFRFGRSRNPEEASSHEAGVWSAAIVAGLFFCGFPAMQAHGWLSHKILWERYAVIGAWLHLPLLAVLLVRMRQTVILRATLAGLVGLGLVTLAMGSRANSLITRDYQPVVRYLEQHARPGDAFLAQDFDLWVGSGNFDTLWFERYVSNHVSNDMLVVSGPWQRRSDLAKRPLDLTLIRPDVERLWVFSLMFNEPMLRSMEQSTWRLESVHQFGRNYPLALFVRVADRAESDTLDAGNLGLHNQTTRIPRP